MYPQPNVFYPMPQNLPPVAPPKPRRAYSGFDSVFAWISFLFAFLFCQALPAGEHPTGAFLLVLLMFAAAFVILRVKKLPLSRACLFTAISSLLVSVAPILNDSAFLIDFSLSYSLCGYCYFLYAAFGNRIETGFSDYVFVDFFKLLFVLPFCSFAEIFRALSSKSAKRTSAVLLKALIGVGIAVVPAALVFVFLSYDVGFQSLMARIFSFDYESVQRAFVSLLFTVPVAMYGFGLYSSCEWGVLREKMSLENCRRGLEKAKILPPLTALVAVLPTLFLYAVYFVSQWDYYVSGFTGVLPDGFSYAEYARRGFFELCAVSVINLLLIVGIAFFLRRRSFGSSVFLKVVSVVFCACTLVLISTAVAKLWMYISFYGLTQKRIFALWLMVLIALVFLVIALGQFVSKLKVAALSLLLFAVLFSALALCNVNALCARYNADRYLSGEVEVLDLMAMKELGDSAVPSLVRVSNEMDAEKAPEVKLAIDSYLTLCAKRLQSEHTTLFSFSVPSSQARAALSDFSLPD